MKKTTPVLLIFFSLLNLIKISASQHTIHIFGDSHAHNSFGNNDTQRYFDPYGRINYEYTYKKVHFAIHWIGSKTLYRIGISGLQALNIKEYSVKENDVAVFTFGEIDARCHIGKQRDQKQRDLHEIIDSLVQNYIQAILSNRAQYNNIQCVVMEIIPPTDQSFNPAVPFYGSLEDRIIITHLMNQSLKEACILNDILFLPTHNLYANKDGSLNTALSDGVVHIGFAHNYLLKNQLIEMLTLANILCI